MAFAHPIRARALIILTERVASPQEIATEIGEPLVNVSYHIRELKKAGLIELVDTDRSRGGVKHLYRAMEMVIVTSEETAKQSLDERETASSVVVQLVLADVDRAISEGTFDARTDRHLSRLVVEVDEEGWRELGELYDATLESATEIAAKSARRLDGSKGQRIPISAIAMLFESPD